MECDVEISVLLIKWISFMGIIQMLIIEANSPD